MANSPARRPRRGATPNPRYPAQAADSDADEADGSPARAPRASSDDGSYANNSDEDSADDFEAQFRPRPRAAAAPRPPPGASPAVDDDDTEAAPRPAVVAPAPVPEGRLRELKEKSAEFEFRDRKNAWLVQKPATSEAAVLEFVVSAAKSMLPDHLQRIPDEAVVEVAQSVCADLAEDAILAAWNPVKYDRLRNLVVNQTFEETLSTDAKATTPKVDARVRKSLNLGPGSSFSDKSQSVIREASDACRGPAVQAAKRVRRNGTHFTSEPVGEPCGLRRAINVDSSEDEDEEDGRCVHVADHVLPDDPTGLGRFVGKGGIAAAREAFGGPTTFSERVCRAAKYKLEQKRASERGAP